jgi:hypothetical protein
MNTNFLIFLLILGLLIPFIYKIIKPYVSLEGYSNYSLDQAFGKYPKEDYQALIQDSYPITGTYGVSDQQGSKMWWHYPIFKVGSYKQLTNNLRYYNNPDDGQCMAAEMCNTMYKSKRNKSNIIKPLPPVPVDTNGVRVNYYNSKINMLPFTNDETNILY